MNECEHFLNWAQIQEMTYKRDPSAHPYMMGAGFVDPYRVSLKTCDGQQGEVIVLIDNEKRGNCQPLAILVAMGDLLNACSKDMASYEVWIEWVKAYAPLTSEDSSFLQDLSALPEDDSYRPHLQEYLQQRYAYLAKMQQVLFSLLSPEACFILKDDFLFRSVIGDFPWIRKDVLERKEERP